MSDVIASICMALLGIASLCSLAFGFIQNLKYKKEREKTVDNLMESAHELAKKKIDGKSLESLNSDINKLYPSTRGDDTESR